MPEQIDLTESDTTSELPFTRCEDCDNEFSFICNICNIELCDNCYPPVEESSYCEERNCYYCKRGSCFKNGTTSRYCELCCPQYVKDENKKRQELEDELDNMVSERPDRYHELIFALEKAGLELRTDSGLCKKYIEYNEGDIDEIVERMCQMKFLFEYQNIREIITEIQKEYDETFEAGYFPDFTVLGESERQILEKIKEYPDVYPWQV